MGAKLSPDIQNLPIGSELAGEPRSWFALQVRTRWESATSALLQGKGFETLLPTYKSKRRWSDRYKIVDAPLFSGYVFCRFDLHSRLPVLITPGVISVVGIGKTPVAVESTEIAAIQKLVQSGASSHPWPYIEIGERVRVEGDVLDGLEGVLTGSRGHERVVISVTLLRRSVAVEIDRARIRPLASSRDAVGASPDLGKVLA